jgi:oligopeptide/dipeptide ABC transporter ATP-binding protein
VAEEAETEELFNRIHHPYSEALLASVPKLDQSRDERLASIPGLPPDLSQAITNCRFAPRCRYATDQCRREDPPLVDRRGRGGPVHRFACFHPVGLADSVRADDVDPADGHRSEAPATSGTGSSIEVSPAQAARAESLAAAERILEVKDLVKEFPVMAGTLFRHQVGSVKAVSGITFGIRKGETFGLVGESGCGKTTTGRLLVSLDRATAGSIHFEGVELSSLGASELRTRRRDLQLMFQDPYASLDPRMRVGTIIREPLKVHSVGDRASQDHKVASLLDEVGLSRTSVERYPHEFSGGQRQRIGLARALALDPKIIVADEPVSALDVSIQAQILNLMKDLQARHDLTYVMISHDLAVVRYMADTIGVMYLGKMVEQGPAADIYARPAHHYTVGLLEAVPVTDVASARLRTHRDTTVKGELPSSINPPSGCRFRTRCPAAQDLCAEVEPPLSDFGNGHVAACHFPLQPTVTPTVAGSAASASS